MRRQHACACSPSAHTRGCNLGQDSGQVSGCARNRGGTEGGDTVPRQPSRDVGNRIARIQRVTSFYAMDVDINETRDDVAVRDSDHGGAGWNATWIDLGDATLVDD